MVGKIYDYVPKQDDQNGSESGHPPTVLQQRAYMVIVGFYVTIKRRHEFTGFSPKINTKV
jgi:hypothetical protein